MTQWEQIQKAKKKRELINRAILLQKKLADQQGMNWFAAGLEKLWSLSYEAMGINDLKATVKRLEKLAK